MKVDRLTGTDLSMLWPDDFGWPQDVGGIGILEGGDLFDSNGDLHLAELRARVAARLPVLPHSRQRLHRPGPGQGLPYWADDPGFDIARHVRMRKLPAPGGEAQLLDVCEELRRRRFDFSHPLWEFWILTGLVDGKVGIFIKIHHALADGGAGVAALAGLFDPTPDGAVPPSIPWNPAPAPTRMELLVDNLGDRWQGIRSTLRGLRHPGAAAGRVLRVARALIRIFRQGRAPDIGLNRPLGDRRQLAVIRGELEAVREVAHAHGGTINDVLLAVLTGGLRDLLASRGETVGGITPRAVVPVAGQRASGTGNATASSLFVPLPVGEADGVRRLELIAEETRLLKQRPLAYDEAGMLSSPRLERVAARFAGRQRVANVYVANLPGPPIPFYFGPAQVLELHPLVPLVGNITVGVGALSYAGQFNLTVVGDPEACPDFAVLVDGIGNSLDRLTRDRSHR